MSKLEQNSKLKLLPKVDENQTLARVGAYRHQYLASMMQNDVSTTWTGFHFLEGVFSIIKSIEKEGLSNLHLDHTKMLTAAELSFLLHSY